MMFSEQVKQAKENVDDPKRLEREVIAGLKNIYDPEIPINIYDLGLIYEIRIGQYGQVYIQMTLTTPNCPIAENFPGIVEAYVRQVPGVSDVVVEVVWEPPWSMDYMTHEGRMQYRLLM